MRLSFLAGCLLLFAACSIPQGPNSSDAKKAAKVIAQLTNRRDVAKLTWKKHPADTHAKQNFVAVNDKLAYTTMTADGLTPHERYAGALKIYRLTLKADPHDSEANHWIQMIESIYRSMHRPIPK